MSLKISTGVMKVPQDGELKNIDMIVGDTAESIAAINSAGATQKNAVNSAGTTQVNNVNNAGTTQIAAVNSAGQAIIDSLPETYTEVLEDIEDLQAEDTQLKEDLVNLEDEVVLIKNHIFEYVEGKYVTANGIYDSPEYSYVKGNVKGGKTYSASRSGSDNFTWLEKTDGTRTKLSTYRDNTADGYIYNMPSNAKYVYFGLKSTNVKSTVLLNVDYNIIGISIVDYPFDTVVDVIIKNQKIQYDMVTRDDVESFLTIGGFKKWGSATVSTDENSYCLVNCTKKSDGAYSSNVISNSDSVKFRLEGSTDISLEYMICYHTNSGTTKYGNPIAITVDDDGNFDFSAIIDFANYIVYKDMKDIFFIIRTSTSGDGAFTLKKVYCWEMSNLEKSDVYDEKLENLLVNMNNKINNMETSTEQIEFKVVSPNGNKSILSILNDGSICAIPVVPQKVLFVGNSLLAGMLNNAYGMCASSPRNDYYYYVKNAILDKNPNAVFTRCHGAQFEQSETDTTAKAYWTTTANSITGNPASQSFTSDLDLIIMQMSDNVSNDTRQTVFANNIDWLVEQIKASSSKARIIWIDGWFNDSRTRNTITSVCKKWNIPRINIADLNIKSNQGYEGQTYEKADGSTAVCPNTWITHPGDTGFEKIANRIINILDM